MRAYVIGDYIHTKQLQMVDFPDTEPGPGEVLMQVCATGPNARDFQIWTTGTAMGPPPADRVPLCDNAGIVLCAGPGVTDFEPGDRVSLTHYWRWLDGNWDFSMRLEDFGQTENGFLRERAVVPARALVKLPDSISFTDASTLPSAGLTAWNAIVEAGGVKAGDTVVTIGTGGVSVFAMQWAKMLGARVIVTSSSDEKLDRMKTLGADDTINYQRHPEWSQAVKDLTAGNGANVVVNNVGTSETDQCLEACASGGRVMFVGHSPVSSDRSAVAMPPLKRLPLLIVKDLSIKGLIVGSRKMYADLVQAVDEHKIKPVIDRIYAFDQANEAVAYTATADKIGKVVIRIG
jgi:NADPH:quinone reductase-like Zn-dependent oxidoreductase